mgnify:CR=1 FL=1
MSNYNGNIEKRKAAQDLMKNRRENTSKYLLRFVKINFCRSCIGSRKRIIKIEKYVISSILYGYFYNGGRFLDIPVYPSW